jgi:arylsulfatase A-like enzyme
VKKKILSFFTALLSAASQAADRPNILFIPVDDLKPMLGCYGDAAIKTPHIDRLAERGMVFLNSHCQQAICGPTRASLMTGLYPDTTRVYDLFTKMRDMNPDVLTLPQYFRQMGYETTGVGKTYDNRCVDPQLDAPSWSIPYYASEVGGAPVWAEGASRVSFGYQHPETVRLFRQAGKILSEAGRNGQKVDANAVYHSVPGSRPAYESMDVPDNAYFDGAMTLGALNAIENLAAGEKPFFLSVGYLKPHLPFNAPKKYWDLYDPETISVSDFMEMPEGAPQLGYQPGWELRMMYTGVPEDQRLPEDYQRKLIHGYMACVSFVDAQIGLLLDKLDETGIAGNTIICLWGDHGWHLGDHNIWCKHSNFEQATRSPLIIAAPGLKKAGDRSGAPTEFVDIFPTLCELAGLDIPAHLPGKSLVPLMAGTEETVKDFALSQYQREHRGVPYMGYAVRDERFRYIGWYKINDVKAWRTQKRDFGLAEEPAFVELYDYETDPLETRNLAQNPEQAARIRAFKKKLRHRLAGIKACAVNDRTR